MNQNTEPHDCAPMFITKGLFALLKDPVMFYKFQQSSGLKRKPSYDVCFRDWPLEAEKYSLSDINKWDHWMIELLGGPDVSVAPLYKFWSDNSERIMKND